MTLEEIAATPGVSPEFLKAAPWAALALLLLLCLAVCAAAAWLATRLDR